MGENLIQLYKEKIMKEWKIAFWAAFTGFLMIHIYKITNYLPNHDSLYSLYSTQDMTASGRWFLQYACGISSYFDLPWVNGLLCAVYLGIATAAIVELLEIRNPVVIVLASTLLVGIPSTTETLFFGFTADGYLMGLAMAAVSACLSSRKGSIGRYILSGLLLCLSCGIYQSCVSFAVMCCICYLFLKLLNHEISVREAWKWIGGHVLLYAAAMISYYVIWKLLMHLKGISATSYQGIDSVGKISLSTLIQSCIQSVTNLVFFFVEWNILEHPISLYGVLNIVFVLCFMVVILIAIVKSRIIHSASRLATAVFCLAASVPMLSIWNFLSPGVVYRPMMLHGICLYYILALILFDRWVPSRAGTAFGMLIAVIAFNFSVMANCAYLWMDQCYEKSYYMGTQLMNTVVTMEQQTDGVQKIAFIGSRAEEVQPEDSPFSQRIHILSMCLEEDLLFDNIHTYLFLQNTFGLEIPRTSEAELGELVNMAQVQQMPVWPAKGSCQMIDGVLIIKLAETSQ